MVIICYKCEREPARGPYKRLCAGCVVKMVDVRRKLARDLQRKKYPEKAKELKGLYTMKTAALMAMTPEELMEYVGADDIVASETPIQNKLRRKRERRYEKDHGVRIRIPIVEIPEVATQDRVKEHCEKKYNRQKKRSAPVYE